MSKKVNITLSADEDVVHKARQYAATENTTLNQLVRDYMARLTGYTVGEDAASAFERHAQANAGKSPEGYRFNRDEAHQRTGQSG